MSKRIFSYEEAVTLMPEVRRLTAEAADKLDEVPASETAEHQRLVAGWAASIIALGLEVKGLWLVDFDSGGGYYCWRHPEPGLEYFHGYDEGFSGRVKLN